MVKQNKKLEIDLLYLDLSICGRCQTTDKVLDEALDELREELKILKQLTVNKIRIANDREAKEYDFVRSPTIRINGVDIENVLRGSKSEITDNYCKDCSEVCDDSCSDITGGGTNCRTFEYKGKTYNSPPKEMIKEAIFKSLN